MAFLVALVILCCVAPADALTSHRAKRAKLGQAPTTFKAFYNGHKSGRGIWKWNNALDAYQRHFGTLAGKPVSVAEVGVQSGGSLQMWQSVLGAQIQMHGLDINPACKQFAAPNVSITIGDQADVKMWQGFFATVLTGLDILVDDGGHEAHQMLTTLKSAFPHINPGGYVAIEDITNAHYLDSFFKPTAVFLAQMAEGGLVDSVHIYPLLLVVRKGGFAAAAPQAAEGILEFSKTKVVVSDLTAMWTAISSAAPGSQITLQNPAWPSFFVADSLTNFFSNFIGLHEAAFKDTPKGCSLTTAKLCTNALNPTTHVQNRVSGVHIYKDRAVIEVPAQPPQIEAVRKGTKWIGYGF